MTINKKRILKILVELVLIGIAIIPYLDWERKNRIHRDFSEIERKIYNNISFSNIHQDSLIAYCDTINQFIIEHPNNVIDTFNCNDFIGNIASKNLGEYYDNFLGNVRKADDAYRESERRANRLMFVILIIVQILMYFSRKLIDKYYNMD